MKMTILTADGIKHIKVKKFEIKRITKKPPRCDDELFTLDGRDPAPYTSWFIFYYNKEYIPYILFRFWDKSLAEKVLYRLCTAVMEEQKSIDLSMYSCGYDENIYKYT